MKIAVTGKGGTGKTTVTAALARTFARLGTAVIAVDADPNPNLGIALGVGLEANEMMEGVANSVLREGAVHHHHHGDADAAPVREAEELLDQLGHLAPDGVRLIQTGRIERPAEGCLCCGSHRATRRMFEELSAEDRLVIADLEAGVNDLCWARPKPTDTVLIVVTPDRNAIENAKRTIQVAHDLDVGRVLVAANRIEHAGESRRLGELLGAVEMVEIPEDPAVAAAERRELSPLDLTPGSPAMLAVHALALRLVR
ncbi:MAG: AAA family ATPase [Actinomycetota bacterium]|nr:AAA family ATPase [Actinomycetota bacterium]